MAGDNHHLREDCPEEQQAMMRAYQQDTKGEQCANRPTPRTRLVLID